MSSRSSSSSSDLLGPSGDNDYLLSSPTKPSTGRQQRFMSPTNFKLLQTPGSVKGKGQRMGSPAKSAHSIRFDDVLLPASPAAKKLNGGRQRSLSPEKGELDGSSSPWRIRVTLEATQDEDEENQSSNPLRKMFGPSTTMTTKVPLKDERDQTEATPRRRRGRPRKTVIQPSPAKSTPTPNASPGHTPGAKGTSGQSKRGRPRKNVLSSTEQQVNERSSPILEQPTPVPKRSSVPEQPTPDPEQPTPLPEQSPPTPFPEQPTLSLETEQEPYSPLNLGADGDSEDDDLPGDMPDDFFPVEQRHEGEQSDTNWNRSSPRVTFNTPDVSTVDRDYDDTKLNSTPSRMPSSSRQPITSSPANTIHAGRTPRPPPRLYPTPTSSSLVGEEDQEPGNVTNQEEPMSEPYQTQEQPMNDPTNEHREFDSIVESEGFSMVSLGTLPSAKQHEVSNNSERAKGPIKPFFEREATRTTERPTKRKASSLSNTYYDDAPDTETQMDPEPAEEPPRKRQTRSPVDHQKRLEQPSSSSRPFEQSMLLSPPGEVTASADNRRRPFSRLARIIRAGVALEGTLRQNHGPDTWPDENYDFDTPRKRLEHVFSDLDYDTQKELRAGLGLGQEIAMRKIQAETERAEREEAEQEETTRVAAEQQELARRQAHEDRERVKREERARRAADQERARKKAQANRERTEQEEAAREAAEEAAEQERARRFQAEIERAEQEEAAAREAAEQERIRRRVQAERQRVEQEEYAARVAAEEAAEEAAHAAEQERVRRKFQAEIERAEQEEAAARQAAEQEHMRRRAQSERQRVEREEAAAREAAVRERMQRRAEVERQKAEQEEAAREAAQAAQAAEQERARRKFQAEIERAEQEEADARQAEQERVGRRAQAERQRAEQEEAARKAAEEEMARREEVQAEIERVEREEAAEQEHAMRQAQAERQRAEQEETARHATEQERARKRAQVEREQAEAARLAAAEQDAGGQYEDEAEENISRTHQWKRGWTPQRRQTRTPQSEQGRTPFHDTPGSDMRRRMAEWQREREAISHEIELANSSQVIVINSDEDRRQRHNDDEDDVQGLEAQFDPRSDDNIPLDLGEAGEDEDSEDYSEEEGPQEQEEEGDREEEEEEEEDEDEEVDDDDVVDIWQQEAQEQSQVSHHSSTGHAKDDAPSESASSLWKGSNAAPSESDNAYSPAHWTHDREKVPYLGGQSRVKQLREQEVDFSSLIRAENTPNHTRYYYGSSSPQSTVNGRSSQRARSNTQSPEKFANNAYGQMPLSDIGLESSPHKPSDDDAFQIDPTTRIERERLRFDRLPENEEEEEEEEDEDSDYSEAAAAEERSVDEKVDMTPQSSRNANPDVQGSTWYQRLVGLTPGWLRAPARKSPMQQRSPVSDADSEHVTDSELGEDEDADADAGAYSNEEDPEQMESQDMEQAFRASRRFTEWRQQHEPQTSPDSRAGQPFSPPGNEARYESSPARPRPAPLSVSGYFTDEHYTVLRRLYRLAKRSPDRFPFYPAPGRGEIIGDWIWTSDGRHGVPVTEGQFAVIDRFVRELSTGDIQGGGTGQIGWTEADLHRRLISVIIGEQIRAERKASMRESEM